MSVVEDLVGESRGMAARARTLRGLRVVLSLVAVADVLTLLLAVMLAWESRLAFDIWARDIDPQASLGTTAGPWIVVAWVLVLGAQGGYALRQFGSGAEEFRIVFMSSVVTAGAVGMFCYLVQIPLSRGFVLLTFVLGTPMLLVERYAARKVVHALRIRGRLVRRVVAVGGPAGVREVAGVLARERYVGYHVVGACLPSDVTVSPGALVVPVLGTIGETREVCDRVGADTVLVARGGYGSSDELRQIAWDLEGGDIDLIVVPSLTDIAGPRISMRPVAGLPLLHVEQPQAGLAGGWSKRSFDVLASTAILVLLSPLMLLVAVAVKLYDGGPVFFRQPRIGKDGEPFGMVKFRSMVVDAEERLKDLEHRNESDGLLFKIKDDPRITPFGRFIRRYSIDELPQLLNVVRGEMSLVGPRPPLPKEVERYGSDVHRRLKVRPGMTGLWQVSGRSQLSWAESVRLDLYYVDNWSMMSDLVIISKTVRAVLRSSGAY